MIEVGNKVKVVKLVADEDGYCSMPEHAIGNTYTILDIRDDKHAYGLFGVSDEITYFREEEIEQTL